MISGASSVEGSAAIYTYVVEHIGPMGRYLGVVYINDARPYLFQCDTRMEYKSSE